MTNRPKEDLLGPPKVDIVSVGIAAMAGFVSGAVGGIFILVCTFLFLGAAKEAAPAIFPYVLSLVGMVAIVMSLFTNFYFNNLIFPNESDRAGSKTGQVFGFCLLMYVLFMPLYVFAGGSRPSALMAVFTAHAIVSTLGSTLIVSVLTRYRYSILSIYSSFIALVAVTSAAVVFFIVSTVSNQILFALSGILIITLTLLSLFKNFAEFLYYKIYSLSGQDILGDALGQIADEENESVEEATKDLTSFK